MKIGVVTESSSAARNKDVVKALEGRGLEIFNLGMYGPDDELSLNYLHISFISAMLLKSKSVDFIVGGCGTGQGFFLGCNQFPGVFCGHITDPLDAWLFRQINNGNAVSLNMNKGYGFGSDQSMSFIFDALFSVEGGAGYPESRKAVQLDASKKLHTLNAAAHRSYEEFLPDVDIELLTTCSKNKKFMELLDSAKDNPAVKTYFDIVKA